MPDVIIKTKSLTKSFKEMTALDKCTVDINQGQVVGLLGPNGAGKTTFLRLLMGFLKPTSGSAIVDGLNAYRDRVQVHHRISYLPGDARLFRTMRAETAIRFFCEVREDASVDRAQHIAQRLELDTRRWIAFMSTGMRQKLALTIALSSKAPILILDEPTANLDPSVRGEVLNFVEEARKQGRTVLFSSHVLPEIEQVCDSVMILRQGELVHQQSLASLKRQHRIVAKLSGEMPRIPESLVGEIRLVDLPDGKVQIESPGELSQIMSWLATVPMQDVSIEPVSLRAVYDLFHRPNSDKK